MDQLTEDSTAKFHPADYGIFGVLMAISAFIGIYFAVTGGRQRTTEEYILANRQMRIVPVALSLIVSFESSIMMLGFPAEMYAYGVQFWTMHIGLIVCIGFICLTTVPLLYPLKITSVYEYLEMRYNSPGVRKLGSFLGIVNYVWYMAVVYYGPATALESVTGFPVWQSVVLVSIGAIFYTTIGGIKAVVWADAVQFVVMIVGLLTIIIYGCVRIGGAGKVLDHSKQSGRLQFFDFNFDPTTRHTFWNLVLAGMIRPVYLGLNQSSIQRVSSMKSVRAAQIMMFLTYPGFLILGTLACFQGLVAYANFAEHQCDPLEAGLIKNTNQILPYFVMDLFRNLPGLPGLFLASLFSASLSTLSSGLSSVSTLFWMDFLQPCFTQVSDFKATVYVKLLVVLFGVLSTGLAFLVLQLEGPLTQIAGHIFGSINGPLVGLFFLGALFRSATAKGAVLGAGVTIMFVLWLAIGSFLSPETKVTPYLPPASTNGCFVSNSSGSVLYSLFNESFSKQDFSTKNSSDSTDNTTSGLGYFYSLSYQWFSIIGMFGTVIMGLFFTYLTGANKPDAVDPKYVIPVLDNLFCYLPSSWRSRHKNTEKTESKPQELNKFI